MTMPSNAIKAEKMIEKMPFGSWVDVRVISKEAQLSACVMSKFLMQARKKGIVEKKVVSKVLLGSIFGDASHDRLTGISLVPKPGVRRSEDSLSTRLEPYFTNLLSHRVHLESGEGVRLFTKTVSSLMLLLLCFSMFSILTPSIVKVSASSPPGKVDNFSLYPSGTYDLLIWGNPLINGYPDTSVTAFKIYKDGSLLATVDWSTCRYRDYNPVNRWCQYGISAVNAAGEGPQYTESDWWSSSSSAYYDLTVYCSPPEGGKISGMFNLRSGQTTAGNAGLDPMVNAWEAPGYNFTSNWTKTGSISITYYSGQRTCYINSWTGDATITAYFQKLPTHDVSISAYCTTEGIDVNAPITMDGVPTGYNTPHNFSSLIGSHTFTVPSTDSNGHPFTQWSTGETTTTVTVTAAGTYIAYYKSQLYSAGIAAHCYQEGIDISVPIIMDGSYTLFNTFHRFDNLMGNHTFTAPETDSKGHQFSQWNTGEKSTTITVSVEATYTVYYDLSYIVLLDMKCSQSSVSSGKNIEVTISGKNSGTSPANRVVEVTMNGVHTTYANLNLQPGQSGSLPVIISTKGLPSGSYSVSATDDQLHISHTINLLGKPNFIIIAGGDESKGDYNNGLIDDCNHAYNILTEKLYVDRSQICYLAPQTQYDSKGNKITSNSSLSFADVYWTLVDWAKDQQNSPLFIYLHGHGEVGSFVLNVNKDGSAGLSLSAEDLATDLKFRTNGIQEQIYIIDDACHSGSFIGNYDLDHVATAIVCSAKSDENTFTTKDLSLNEHGMFSNSFWAAIGESKSVFGAYNKAGWDVRALYFALAAVGKIPYIGSNVTPETPVFDDIQSGNAFYGVSSVTGPKIPGSHGEGNCLSNIYMGKCEWTYPYVESCSPSQYYTWPPTENITLWAVIRNDTALSNVTLMMLPPDLSPGNDTLNLEIYQMQDARGDGNFSVQIPYSDFTNHASGLGNFSFFLVARQQDGMSAYECEMNVVFTQNGQPKPDNTAPAVFITRPLDLDIVDGTIKVNGTVSDDNCLLKTELYVDNILLQQSDSSASSFSVFQYNLDTLALSNGYHNITVNVFDTSGNYANETVGVWVMNDVHDVAMVSACLPKTLIGSGSTLNVTAILANRGTYTENGTMALGVNSTTVGTDTIENLSSGAIVDNTLIWNTTGFAYGNYTIIAYVNAVPNETDVENNINTCNVTVHLGVLGDVSGVNPGVYDGVVNMRDIAYLVSLFNTKPDSLNWNPNADVNNDGVCNMKDIAIAVLHFNQHE